MKGYILFGESYCKILSIRPMGSYYKVWLLGLYGTICHGSHQVDITGHVFESLSFGTGIYDSLEELKASQL